MTYHNWQEVNYNITTIKTDKFKSSDITMTFIIPYHKEELAKVTLLKELLRTASKKFHTHKEMALELEELFNANFNISTWSNNYHFYLNIDVVFVNPEFVDKDLMEKIIDFIYEFINNPDIKNNEFDERTFKIAKNDLISSLERAKENAKGVAFRNALKIIDPDLFMCHSLINNIDEVRRINAQEMYEYYNDFFEKAALDIVIGGNLDMDKAVKYINKHQKFNVINNFDKKANASFKKNNKQKLVIEDSKFKQSIFLMFFQEKDFSLFERIAVAPIFNGLFGGGGMQNKLFLSLREKNSLCYEVSSHMSHLISMMWIVAGIDGKNYKKAELLSKKALQEMADGNFSDDNLNAIKKQIIYSLEVVEDDIEKLMDYQISMNLYDLPSAAEKISLVKKVTREDIVALAKKMEFVMTYLLKEVE